jgi:hypothetical protein
VFFNLAGVIASAKQAIEDAGAALKAALGTGSAPSPPRRQIKHREAGRNLQSRDHKPFQGRGSRLNVVVQRKLVGMRPQTNRIRFALAFVLDESFDQIFAEDVALEQEVVILGQTIQSLFE